MSNFHDLDLDDGKFKNYPKEWTSSLWLMKRDDDRNLEFHGANIPNIQRLLFQRYTKEGDLVVDWFAGSGTTALVARETNRWSISIDLNGLHLPGFLDSQYDGWSAWSSCGRHLFLRGDSTSPDALERVVAGARMMTGAANSATQFAFLHPPYHNIIKFTDNSRDLSGQKTTGQFTDLFRLVASNAIKALEPGRWAALLVGDMYEKGEFVPLSYYCFMAMCEVGFIPKAEVIKDINGNEAKGRDGNLWHYRHLKNGTFDFSHEKLFIFRKPK